ncbi:DUF1989 domain-containing protein [Mesorhizobium sp. 1B3]|uniref:DUF1989 domain-containing protein n=1 Tax=Mesorhizobium sp. 1B3 TaxID=3243599 RepID=UPI003D98CFF3
MALIYRALGEYGRPAPQASADHHQQNSDADTDQSNRELVDELIMEPGTGKAVEVLKDQILKIEQIEGPQCVDFNCFNLHDYKEAMHVGRIRAVHGLSPTAGHFIWSAPPRERAMMYIMGDTANCNDVLFSRCSAYLYESAYGFAHHTNCHDIQAEAQREYGLTPDDVHDSLNFFMCTGVEDNRAVIKRQRSNGDHCVELLALMDVLAVPNVCGNDVGRTSNFSLKKIKVSVFSASENDLARVPPLKTFPTNLRTPASFRQPNIKADRPLKRDPSYEPQFTNVPLATTRIEVPMNKEIWAKLNQAGNVLREYHGDDDAALLRDVVLSWWEIQYTNNLPGTVD